MRKPQIIRIVLGLALLGLTAVGAIVYSIASGPDFDVEMVRPIPSKLSAEFLDQALNYYPHWPAWFYSAASLVQVDAHGTPVPATAQKLQTGDFFRLGIDTKRLHGKYDVTVQVTQYTPRKLLVMHVVSDSKGKLTHLFSSLDWKIELVPQPSGTLIIGTALAHTHTWRARVFGRLIPTILLNQVYYPNLMVLAEINNPNVVFPEPDAEHGAM